MNELLFYDLKKTFNFADSIVSRVVSELGQRIVTGGYSCGDKLDDEVCLSDHYDVELSVINDAIEILVSKGLLEKRGDKGVRVRDHSNWSLLDSDVLAWQASAPFRVNFWNRLMDLRLAIEPKACWCAAKRGTSTDLLHIKEAQERMGRAKNSIKDFVVTDALFHQSILRAADNELFLGFEGVVFSALISSYNRSDDITGENEYVLPFHLAVTDAILAQDAETAAARMEKLLTAVKQQLGNNW